MEEEKTEEKVVKKEMSWKMGTILSDFPVAAANSVRNYNPFYEKDSPAILDIVCTGDKAYVLLKNGLLIKLLFDAEQNIDKINELLQFNQIPNAIKFSTKIVDVACGFEHTIARGRNDRIYAWGKNTYGQLGLGKSIEETNEPVEITRFTLGENQPEDKVITQIYAVYYNTFLVDKNNTIYGFGINDLGQVKLGSREEKRIYFPVVLNFGLKKDEKYDFLFSGSLKKKYVVTIPKKTNTTSELEKDEEAKHHAQVSSLKENIRKLKTEIARSHKSLITVEDYKNLIKDIEGLIQKCEEEEAKITKADEHINRDSLDPINSYKKQFEYIKSKNFKKNAAFENYMSSIDKGTHSKYVKNKKGTLAFSQAIPQAATLLERVNAELQNQEKSSSDYVNKIKSKNLEAKHDGNILASYINLYKEVIRLANEKIKFLEKNVLERETVSIKEKCLDEYESFSNNLLINLTTRNFDVHQSESPTLTELAKYSTRNLSKLDEKISSLKFRESMEAAGNNIVDMFRENIFLSFQNNDLMSFVLNNLVDCIDEKISLKMHPEETTLKDSEKTIKRQLWRTIKNFNMKEME